MSGRHDGAVVFVVERRWTEVYEANVGAFHPPVMLFLHNNIIIIIIFHSPVQHKTNKNNNSWIQEYARRLPEKQTLIELATYRVI